MGDNMKLIVAIIASTLLVSGCAKDQSGQAEAPIGAEAKVKRWQTVFFDDFDTFNSDNWRDQILWVNGEDQCYVRDGQHGTREVSDGTLKLRVVDLGEKQPCDNMDKFGKQHADTQFVAGRISSKNRQEFAKGRWTARLKVPNSGQDGMFPAWWLLGSLNNEPPVEEPDETVCWPMIGSGEIDIFEHHGDGGPNHYAARTIKNGGACDEGDWQALMLVKEANFDEFQDYGVAFEGDDIVFYLNDVEVYRNVDIGPELPEPMFAILNFAKINANAMTVKQWEMEVDWVKWEEWK
jgi:beta-glucanase (GH16 family)